jgi:hypothetical protein
MTDVMKPIIEIRDPEIDQQTIRERIRAQIAQRLADGVYQADLDIPGPYLPLQQRAVLHSTPETEFSTLIQTLLELTTMTTLHEPVFQSSVPLFGPLIVLIRRCWNWMSTKWYVLPVMRQQSLVNKRINLIVDELEHWQALQGRRLVELETRVKALEACLVRQERQ